eukprot:1147540-Pelagomonas_calceolata.AAC.1
MVRVRARVKRVLLRGGGGVEGLLPVRGCGGCSSLASYADMDIATMKIPRRLKGRGGEDSSVRCLAPA